MADAETPVVLSPEFQKAAEEVTTLAKQPDDKQRLQLYTLFKIGKNEKVREGSLWEPQRKVMHNAWKAEKEKTKTPQEGQKKYVELVEQLKKEIGTK